MTDEPFISSDERPKVDPKAENREVESGPTTHGNSKPPMVPRVSKAISETVHRVKSVVLETIENWGPWKRWNRYCKFYEHDSSASFQEHDRKENVEGRLPNNERVQVPAIWVAELYTPSTVSGLLEGIEDLGWDHLRMRNDSLLKWMGDVRQGRTAGWTNLGVITRKETGVFYEQAASLPECVNALLPVFISITPSLTLFVATFLLTDDCANKLDAPLRNEYTTQVIRDRRFRRRDVARYILWEGRMRFGHRIYHPDLLRRNASKACLESMGKECIKWVQQHLPGGFALLKTAPFPTAALLVTDETQPFSDEARQIRAFRALSLDHDFAAWESTEWPQGRLIFPNSWDEDGARLVFACRRRDAFPEESGYPEPTSNWTIAQRADDHIRGLLSRWALTCLLDSYHQRLAVLRDRVAGKSTYWPVSDLKTFRSLAGTAMYDMVSVAQEVEKFAELERDYRYEVMEMRQIRHKENSSLIEGLRSSQRNRAQQIQRESALLQSTLSVGTGISQTISNIRIQRFIILLAVIAITIAIWAALRSQSGPAFPTPSNLGSIPTITGPSHR